MHPVHQPSKTVRGILAGRNHGMLIPEILMPQGILWRDVVIGGLEWQIGCPPPEFIGINHNVQKAPLMLSHHHNIVTVPRVLSTLKTRDLKHSARRHFPEIYFVSIRSVITSANHQTAAMACSSFLIRGVAPMAWAWDRLSCRYSICLCLSCSCSASRLYS